jgi:endonuclease YncB( thermonuclease family)
MVRPHAAVTLALAFALPFPAMDSHAAHEIVGRGFVQDDGTLLINNQVVHLYGIYIPPTAGDVCLELNGQPAGCGPRPALDFRLAAEGFVRCYPQEKYDDGSLSAVCYVGWTNFNPGKDLAAYLLQQGYALATDYAPPEYGEYESMAQSQGRGVWRVPAGTINRQPFRGHR